MDDSVEGPSTTKKQKIEGKPEKVSGTATHKISFRRFGNRSGHLLYQWKVTKNKAFRLSLKLDGTLSSILTIQLANPESCFKYEPANKCCFGNC